MHESSARKMVKTYRKWLENAPIISNGPSMDKSMRMWYTANDCKTDSLFTAGGTHSMYKRLLAILLVCVLAFACPRLSFADTAPASAPMTAGNTQNGMVRVRLSSLGEFSSLNLTVLGSYSVSGSSARTLSGGASITVKFNSATGRFTLVSGGASTDMGSSFRLCRHATDGQNGIRIAQGRVPANLYPGDFQFVARSSNGNYVPWVIAHVYMEDYLYGVVPYEMNDASGMEALKAQAVAARTYTMLRMSSAGAALYDVVDTTADQVYSGTPSGNANCKAAVDATKGVALKNGSSFTATYYTASNGGQTESIKNAWGTAGLDYLGVKDDPYDLKNPDSRKVSFIVSASGAQSDSRVSALLNQKAAAQFGAGASVTAVTGLYAHTPKYAAPSRLYTKLSFDVVYTRNGQTGSGTLTFDIFSELESALSMNITSGSCELWSVAQENGRFTVTARRYGHGIGMSQRGAMYMGQLGYTYDQILGFYYEGCKRVAYTLTRSILSPAVNGQTSQEQVIVEQPVNLEPSSASIQAQVTTKSGSLNLRQSPSASAKVLCTIPQYTVIPIYEQGASWCKTAYGGFSGYVMTSFLTFSGQSAASTPAPASTPSPAQEPASQYARVTTQSGSLNLRQSPSSFAKVLRTIPQNETIPILEKGASWCKTAYGGFSGYVMTSFLTFSGQSAASTPAPASTPSPAQEPASQYARVTTQSGSLNLRQSPSSSAKVLRTIPQNETVPILEKSASWCKTAYGGDTGYVMTQFLTFASSSAQATAKVTTQSGSLNLRESANTSSRVLRTIPRGDMVVVLDQGAEWCRVAYNGVTGCVMTQYLTFSNGAAPVTDSGTSLTPLGTPRQARIMPTASTLNLRDGCSLSAALLMEMPKYDMLMVTAYGDTWCAVVYESRFGYCMTQYLEFVNE